VTTQPARRADAPGELIIFRVAKQEFCVDATLVKEIRGWTHATRLPSTPTYMRGVINLRGAILPILDFAVRLKLPEDQLTPRHVVIVVWIGKKLVGLLVDAVIDIQAMPTGEALQPIPELAGEMICGLVSALVRFEDRMIGLINLDNILPISEDVEP
jgi:purine-binding chemotaxis protein CheW